MFKKNQLVRSKDTGRHYQFLRVEKTHFMSGDKLYRDYAVVRVLGETPMYGINLNLPLHILEPIGNNYKDK